MFTLTSLYFLLFVAAALFLYYIAPKHFQYYVLIAASSVFIALYSSPAVFVFLAADITVIYFGGILQDRLEEGRLRNLAAAVSVILITALLFLLKYYNNVAEWFPGLNAVAWRCDWPVPIGISYFTLSAVGYLLDINWQVRKAERNPLKLVLLVIYFPALVCGPIVRYSELEKSLFAPHSFDYTKVKFGAERVLYGLFKKLVAANRAALLTGTVFSAPRSYSGLVFPFTVLIYALQIYCDFSGCMDIILGVSEMFQVELPENFRQPFFSQDLSEFWRRWHITLGQWAKDYVMYPLLKSSAFVSLADKCKKRWGKKRGKAVPTYLAMLALWLVIGLWHGGTVTHIFACGILLWIFIVGGMLLQPFFDRLSKFFRVDKARFRYKLFCSLRTLMLMCIMWLFFNLGIKDGWWAIKNTLLCFNIKTLFDNSPFELMMWQHYIILAVSLVILLVIGVMQEQGIRIRQALEKQSTAFQWGVLLPGILFVVVYGIYGPGYNPADFIYR